MARDQEAQQNPWLVRPKSLAVRIMLSNIRREPQLDCRRVVSHTTLFVGRKVVSTDAIVFESVIQDERTPKNLQVRFTREGYLRFKEMALQIE